MAVASSIDRDGPPRHEAIRLHRHRRAPRRPFPIAATGIVPRRTPELGQRLRGAPCRHADQESGGAPLEVRDAWTGAERMRESPRPRLGLTRRPQTGAARGPRACPAVTSSSGKLFPCVRCTPGQRVVGRRGSAPAESTPIRVAVVTTRRGRRSRSRRPCERARELGASVFGDDPLALSCPGRSNARVERVDGVCVEKRGLTPLRVHAPDQPLRTLQRPANVVAHELHRRGRTPLSQ